MDVIIDASCVMSILLGEDEAKKVKEQTAGITLVSPTCLPYEVGNSLTSSVKRHRIDAEIITDIFKEFKKMPIRLVETDIEKALKIAADEHHYAYDAYYVSCALERGLPLFSLDNRLIEIAKKRGVECL